jgi:hypothetical protein
MWATIVKVLELALKVVAHIPIVAPAIVSLVNLFKKKDTK